MECKQIGVFYVFPHPKIALDRISLVQDNSLGRGVSLSLAQKYLYLFPTQDRYREWRKPWYTVCGVLVLEGTCEAFLKMDQLDVERFLFDVRTTQDLP